jgi:16S rRNA (adenine1518-N6/adenine1519-N6)-dimethyltransferase
MKRKNIVVVDKDGNFLKEEVLEETIQEKLIRRVARIFVFNHKRELFLQKRTSRVRAWPDRWDNSAGGFMDPGETIETTARRELQEELGIKNVPLTRKFDIYNEEKDDGKIVFRNYETVFFAAYDGPLHLDAEEVAGGRWISITDLQKEINSSPQSFSPGMINAFRQMQQDLKRMK